MIGQRLIKRRFKCLLIALKYLCFTGIALYRSCIVIRVSVNVKGVHQAKKFRNINRLIFIVFIGNQIRVCLTRNGRFNIIKLVVKVKQCQVRDLNRGIASIGEARDILYISDNFYANVFSNILWDFIAFTHDGGIRMASIKNAVKEFIILVILISNINSDFRFGTIEC